MLSVGIAVGPPGIFVAFGVKMLHPNPQAFGVDVGYHLGVALTSSELHQLPTEGAACRVARLDGACDCPTAKEGLKSHAMRYRPATLVDLGDFFKDPGISSGLGNRARSLNRWA